MMWPPSPMGSPPQRNLGTPAGSPETDPGQWAPPTLLAQEQQEQLRRMEQRAPLLYGPQGRNERAQEGSSGGSTYEAVQDEVKRQLRGVVSQLEDSRREAQGLREEVEQLRAGQHQAALAAPASNMRLPEGPPTTLGGYLAGQVAPSDAALTAPTVSGSAALTAPTVPGSTAWTAPTVSGAAALTAPTVSGSAAWTAPTVSGSAALRAPTVSGLAGIPAPMAVTQGIPPMPVMSGPAGALSTSAPAAATSMTGPVATGAQTMTSGAMAAGDPMSRLLEGLERVIKGGKPEELSKSQEAPKLPEFSDTSSVLWGLVVPHGACDE